jgi:preprotein translocase subunit SecB
MNKLTQNTNKEVQPNLKDAVQVAEQVELQEVRLLGCNCNQSIKNIQGNKCFDVDKDIDVQVDREAGRIFVVAKFSLKTFLEKEKNDPFATIDASFLLVYNAKNISEMPDEYFDSFGKTNGIYNAWPYWREFVQNATTRMGLPSLTMPVFRIVKPADVDSVQSKSVKKKVSKKVKSKAVSKKKTR